MNFKLVIVFAVFAIALTNAAVQPWEPWPNDSGWVEPLAQWIQQHEGLVNQTKQHGKDFKAVFLGDSITEGWKWQGKATWDAHYLPRGTYNYGISGDTTQNVLWRLAHGELDGTNPKLVVLLIGTNNIGSPVADIARGVRVILDALRAKLPNSKILLLSLLPRTDDGALNLDTKIHEVNKLIAKFADKKAIHYLELTAHFESSLNQEISELYREDKLHLQPKGYELWYKLMEPSFVELIK